MIYTIIIKGFFTIINNIINIIPTWEPILDTTNSAWVEFTNTIFENIGLIDIFIPINFLCAVLGCMLGLLIVKWTINIVMWVLKKIPLASMS